MTPDETRALAALALTAHDRAIPGLADTWHATLGDLPFRQARAAVVELLKTSPWLPKPAEIRERARLIKAADDREIAKRRQLAGRAADVVPPVTARNGASMVRHVLGRLKDAGQDTRNGKFLGVERATAIAETAVREWLANTPPQEAKQ